MAKKKKSRKIGPQKHPRRAGTHVVYPAGLCDRYGVHQVTVWRWEINGRLPPRDAFICGKPVGWRPETLDAADRGELVAA